jgi:hypothetical protein
MIHAQKRKYKEIKPELHAERLKFRDFDCFTLHGTDSDGNKFKVEFHLDPGQQFEMSTRLAYDHPDNPKNQLKED